VSRRERWRWSHRELTNVVVLARAEARKPRFVIELPAPIIDDVERVLRAGAPTKFRYEASCRAGLRSALCLEGVLWAVSDMTAAAVVAAALGRIGAERPAWWEGQLEYADTSTERGWCAWERCGRPLPLDGGSSNGVAMRYCSEVCKSRAHAHRVFLEGKKATLAQYLAGEAAKTEKTLLARARNCEQCGRYFLTRQLGRKYCSRACRKLAVTVYRARPCAACGKSFKPKLRRTGRLSRFCSQACAIAARPSRFVGEPCPVCGKMFRPKRRPDGGATTCCSRRCAGRLRAKPSERECPICHAAFRPPDPRTTCCSRRCAAIWRWQIRAARRA
jgi:hypothetical protein